MNADAIATLLLAMICFALGVFVFLYNTKVSINRLFFVFNIAIALWILSSLAARFSDITTVTPYVWIGYAAATLSSLFFLLFTIEFPVKFPFLKLWHYILLLFLPIIFVVLSFLNLVAIAVPTQGMGFEIIPGIFYLPFGIFLSSYFISGLVILAIKYRKLTGVSRYQIFYVLLGFSLTSILAIIASLILPRIPGLPTDIYKWGIYATLFFIVLTAYAILAHHLFDIRIIIKKTLVYSGLLAFVLITYALIVMSLSVVFSGQLVIFGPNGVFTAKMIAPNIVAAIFIALGFGPLENWLSHITDKWLFKGDYDQQVVLSKLSDNLSTVIDLNEALASMMKTITEAMRVKTAATFVLTTRIETRTDTNDGTRIDTNKENTHEHGTDDARINTNKGTQIDTNKKELEVKTAKLVGYDIPDKDIIEKVHPIIDYFESQPFNAKTVIIADDIKQNKETRTNNTKNTNEQATNDTKLLACLEDLHIAFAMPISTKDKMIGLFILGEKLSGDIFNEKDLNLLDIAVKQTAAAIEKARFYEEDQLKSEFVSIASHELLTPTSAIEGYLSMILDEHLAKVDKKAEGYLVKVQASAQRLAVLVKDLLNVSRIEGGRIIIKWQAFDIAKLINTVIEELEPKAKEKKLKLEFINSNFKTQILNQTQNSNVSNIENLKLNKNLKLKIKNFGQGPVMVFADEERTHQVLVNLIGNAIKYTEHGKVAVQILNDKSQANNGMATISVIDSGMGMSEADQKHLFEKFYRASNANKFGAGGTGLGLYISKNITELMGGKIWLKSVEDKGSTFYFDLKLATPDQIKNNSTRPEGDGYVAYKK